MIYSTFCITTTTVILLLSLLAKEALTCKHTFTSDASKNGTFTSPNWPNHYPKNMNCIYEFSGSGKERVQINFTDFQLYLPADEPPTKDCEEMDAVMVFVTINGNKERIDNYCGNESPKQLMSNGPSLTVEFRSTSHSSKHQGFRAIYSFITNFGITTGIQDEKRGVCAFVYNSQTHPNGSITSPNYPGLYPRDTECHYFFYGQRNERVHITFPYFDVEGIPPCYAESASDYVEFSNYKTVDRKMQRHCGVKQPRSVASDREFFRITFKSNDKFDGTGFEAYYQFRNSSIDETVGAVTIRHNSVAVKSQSYLSTIISGIVSIVFLFPV